MSDDRFQFHLKTDGPSQKRNETVESHGLFYRLTLVGDYSGLKREIELATILRDSGVPIPKGVYTQGGPVGYQVWQKANGVTLDKLPDHERSAAYAELGRVLKVLHGLPAAGAGLVDGLAPVTGAQTTWADYVATNAMKHIEYIADNTLLPKDICNQIAGVLGLFCESEQKANRPLSVLHGDLNDRNILWGDGRISAIIDWEDALVGDPVYELALWATFTRPGWTGGWTALIDSYYGENAGSIACQHDWQSQFWHYYLRVSVSKLVLLHKSGYKDLKAGTERIIGSMKKLETIG